MTLLKRWNQAIEVFRDMLKPPPLVADVILFREIERGGFTDKEANWLWGYLQKWARAWNKTPADGWSLIKRLCWEPLADIKKSMRDPSPLNHLLISLKSNIEHFEERGFMFNDGGKQ